MARAQGAAITEAAISDAASIYNVQTVGLGNSMQGCAPRHATPGNPSTLLASAVWASQDGKIVFFPRKLAMACRAARLDRGIGGTEVILALMV